MTSTADIQFREGTSADVPAMARCRLADPPNSVADPRMAAYFNGQHHPQQALIPRVGYLAMANDEVIGYIAGHRTTRNGCAGEVQYLFVAPSQRRRESERPCFGCLLNGSKHRVLVAFVSASLTIVRQKAKPFYESVGALPLKRNWYWWEDIEVLLR